jgi:cytoskeletal protein CcmA (bactofilin family)
MFGRKNPTAIEVTRLSSLVAHNMVVRGDILFEGGLRVDGRIEGNVLSQDQAHGLLVLSDKGAIAGRVRVYDAVINGRVEGDLEVEHFLELQANAQVTGNIIYTQLQMDCGATVDGKLERIGSQAALPAPDDKVVALISPAASAAKG